MLFVPLLFIVTVIAAVSFFWNGVPSILAWTCLIFASLAIFSRGLAWLSGAAQSGIRTLSQKAGPAAVTINIAMELAIWISAFANLYFFFVRTPA